MFTHTREIELTLATLMIFTPSLSFANARIFRESSMSRLNFSNFVYVQIKDKPGGLGLGNVKF